MPQAKEQDHAQPHPDKVTERVGQLFRRRSMALFQRDVIEGEISHIDICLKLEVRKNKPIRLVRIVEDGEMINFD